MRRLPVVALTLLVSAAACQDESPTSVDQPQFARSEAATGMAGEALYRITFTNLTGGQPFTPPAAAVHRQSISLFDVGEPAIFEVKEIAENGNLAPLLDLAGTSRQVIDAVVTPGAAGPVLPGETVAFDVEGRTGAKYLSIVAMLICTNDGFTGTTTTRLPKRVGDAETFAAYAYDAGTEMNTESWSDLVPPCAGLTGFDNGGQGSGMSHPDLYEGSVVRMHPGISGDADLDASVHGWDGPVAEITIERIG
jgi:hypothetical protein